LTTLEQRDPDALTGVKTIGWDAHCPEIPPSPAFGDRALDSGAHVSQVLDASITAFFLAYWVKQEQALTWEEAFAKLTLQPALLMGFLDRRTQGEGAIADLAVLDPHLIGPGPAGAARDLLAAGRRLRQKASGLKATIVACEPGVMGGEPTGSPPGRLLRGGRSETAARWSDG
jgi:N-acyl-D-amino-acid deacylase